jgi:hypothetical protein
VRSLVLGDCRSTQRDVGGSLVDVGHGDCEGLFDEQASRIGAAHSDAETRLSLEVERGSRLKLIPTIWNEALFVLPVPATSV